MSRRQRSIQRDDFDIASRDQYDDDEDDYHHHRGGSSHRSIYSRGSHSRGKDSRSRSRSLEKTSNRRDRHRYGGRYSDSRSRSRSRSKSGGRSYSSRRRLDSGGSRSSRRSARRYRDSRSHSYSKSPSRSPAYYRRRQGRSRDNDRDYIRRSSKSRSRSRSSSHFRDFSRRDEELKKAAVKNLKAIKEDSSDGDDDVGDDTTQESKHSHDSTQADNLEDLPLPQQKQDNSPTKADNYKFDEEEPIDRARIHREMEEKLRQALAKEGKVYPPPKPEASHPVFANDGSFLEIFKKMQEQQKLQNNKPSTSKAAATVIAPVVAKPLSAAPTLAAAASVNPLRKSTAPPPPIVGRRKGGKILKTGVVAKPKAQNDTGGDSKDFWSLYLAEVNKYKNTACESEQGNRPLIK